MHSRQESGARACCAGSIFKLVLQFHTNYDHVDLSSLRVVPYLPRQLSIDPYLVELFLRVCFRSWPSLE